MSVEKMTLVNIVGPIHQFDDASKHCISGKNFQPENTTTILSMEESFTVFSDDNPYVATLRQVNEFSSRAKLGLQYNDFCDISDTPEGISRKINELNEQFENYVDEIKKLESRILEDEQILIQLDHIKNLSITLDDLFNLEFICFRFGRLSRENYEKMNTYADLSGIFFFDTFKEKEYVWGMFFYPRINKATYDEFLKTQLSFERIRISDRVTGTPSSAYIDIRNDIEANKISLKVIQKEYDEFLEYITVNVLPCYSKIRYLHDTFELRKYATHSNNNFYIVGWVPQSEVKEFANGFAAFENISCVVETPDEVHIPPPTRLKNFALFKPFEEFVKLYGLPNYNEVDPSPIVAIIYTILFGIMFGDVGQGVVILLAGLFLWLVKKKGYGQLVATLGLSSACFGTIYGSVFGYENIIHGLIKPLENTNIVLGIAIGLGTVLISIGMIINIYNGFKQKDMEKAIFSHNGIVGLIFYWAVLIGIICSVLFNYNIISIWYTLLFFVLPIILFFLKEPLAHILQKKGKFKFHNGISDFIIVNFFELFDVLLSFVSNTISFVRVGAFVISHAVMMLVVFALSEGASNTAHPFGIVVGNAFVIVLEGLIVGIQVIRLNFFEIFSRFYSGEGRDYEPIEVNYK
jgi:V/A-type H+-transporting ATPase subunit I